MQAIGQITVFPALPTRINRLRDLAYNMYWSWMPDVQQLFEFIDPKIFSLYRNPVRLLLETSQANLDRAATSREFLKDYDAALAEFDDYMKAGTSWYQSWQQEQSKTAAHDEPQGPYSHELFAYFSMEYGLHESIQIYSGGLGVLAGDHCKSASDLGLPFVAVGLLFREGYFHQHLNHDGWQEEHYETLDPRTLPLEEACTPEGKPIRLDVELLGRSVTVRAWRLAVGRINLYLLDTDCAENSPEDRLITARLYGQGQELRINQELVLGVGGVRVLRALGLKPTVFHMNEGHAAFLGLERMRSLIEAGAGFHEAIELVAANSIFTTHTPVSAGNDAFTYDLIDRLLGHYWYAALHVSREAFLDLARQDQPWGQGGSLVPTFSMTVLALRLSRFHNGVSELHGAVSRKMWNFLWPGALEHEVPIGHVTNGIHTRTFLAEPLERLFDEYLEANWDERISDLKTWEAIDNIPDNVLWEVRMRLKERLIHFARTRLHDQFMRYDMPLSDVAATKQVLNPRALTIGFARRFATYKRALLIFRDLDRLKALLNNPERPVQIIFAGKAHPADNPGKEFIQMLYRYSLDPELKGKIVFLENYDMNVARHLVQGCDVWLNNPRRPLEASGTSGEKASLNGLLNFSVLDGWWREGFDGENGFAIGEEREYTNFDLQDDADAYSFYDTLEHQLMPYYFSENDGPPHLWLKLVRRAIRSVAPRFSMARQVQDYTCQYYLPAHSRGRTLSSKDKNGKTHASSLAAWKTGVRQTWHDLQLRATFEAPDTLLPETRIPVRARVLLHGFHRDSLRVEAVLIGEEAGEDGIMHPKNTVAELIPVETQDDWVIYQGEISSPEAGRYTIGVRAYPYDTQLASPFELGLVRWAE